MFCRLGIFVFPFFLSACTVMSQRAERPYDPQRESAAYNRVHLEVVRLLSDDDRKPAADLQEQLRIDLRRLSQIKPNKFEVYVFPKVHFEHLKTKENLETVLGRPQIFEVSVLAENPCREFFRGLFASLRPQEIFSPQLSSESERRCAIIEVTSLRTKNLNRALVRPDDILSHRLFLDDQYILHGLDYLIYSQDRKLESVRVRTGQVAGSSSGLSLFPIDLPVFKAVRDVEFGSQGVLIRQKLDRVSMRQLRKLNRGFAIPNCEGARVTYSDYFGQNQISHWCQGQPWPAIIENSKFLAVTQELRN